MHNSKLIRKIYALIVLLSVFILDVYGQQLDISPESFIETESGLKYYIFHHGNGQKINEGDMLYVHYIGRLDDSTIFDNTYEKNYPLIFTLGVGQVIKGWEEVFSYLREGDKALLVVPPDLAYGNNANGNIPANATLTFLVEILHVIKSEAIQPYNVAGKDTFETTSGLKYIIIEEGYGMYPRDNDLLLVDYTGFLSSGKIFDSSVRKDKPFKFSLGDEKILKGWDEGLRKIGEGGMIKLIIPPHLAYGENGFKNIVPPNETLVFDILLMEVKPEIIVEPFDIEGKQIVKTESGLEFIIVEQGIGEKPDTNNIVTVHYTGYFKNGEMFDSSVKRDEPIRFPLGINAVIQGWEEALFMMQEGTKARIIVPYKLGYGKNGNPPVIPRKTDLIFDIELLNVM